MISDYLLEVAQEGMGDAAATLGACVTEEIV